MKVIRHAADEVALRSIDAGGADGLAERWLVGLEAECDDFDVRYIRVEPGGVSDAASAPRTAGELRPVRPL